MCPASCVECCRVRALAASVRMPARPLGVRAQLTGDAELQWFGMQVEGTNAVARPIGLCRDYISAVDGVPPFGGTWRCLDLEPGFAGPRRVSPPWLRRLGPESQVRPGFRRKPRAPEAGSGNSPASRSRCPEPSISRSANHVAAGRSVFPVPDNDALSRADEQAPERRAPVVDSEN
jgi:hypothetical protein